MTRHTCYEDYNELSKGTRRWVLTCDIIIFILNKYDLPTLQRRDQNVTGREYYLYENVFVMKDTPRTSERLSTGEQVFTTALEGTILCFRLWPSIICTLRGTSIRNNSSSNGSDMQQQSLARKQWGIGTGRLRLEYGLTGTQFKSSMETTMSITFMCEHMYKINLLLFQPHYLQYSSPIHGDERGY